LGLLFVSIGRGGDLRFGVLNFGAQKKGKLLLSHRSTKYPCFVPNLGESMGAGRRRLTRHKSRKKNSFRKEKMRFYCISLIPIEIICLQAPLPQANTDDYGHLTLYREESSHPECMGRLPLGSRCVQNKAVYQEGGQPLDSTILTFCCHRIHLKGNNNQIGLNLVI